MPVVVLPRPEVCQHNNIHPHWTAQGISWAICNLPKPRLINSINMLQETLDRGYPYDPHAKQSPLIIRQTEDQLRMLKGELERRNDKRLFRR